eukprot:TRINITY_DN1065_c0_g1_i2.p1 TRINITY_DN1065_c0_g1~~TRINITY_DN1065_c0_g1_i2.p1  ORF type:complete len:281 (-),score=53.10 TRINITY_DN1065_c0_g1_i2:10-774(-)
MNIENRTEKELCSYLRVIDHSFTILYQHEEKHLSPQVIRRSILSLISKVIIDSLRFHLGQYPRKQDDIWSHLSRMLNQHMQYISNDGLAIFFGIFQEQDDLLIAIMNDLLIMFNLLNQPSCIEQLHKNVPELPQEVIVELIRELYPHKVFSGFLKCIESDHLVMMDFLLSDDTEFLSFLLRYVKFCIQSMQSDSLMIGWYRDAKLKEWLEEDIPPLVKLRIRLEKSRDKKLIGFNIDPLLNKINEMEHFWENLE